MSTGDRRTMNEELLIMAMHGLIARAQAESGVPISDLGVKLVVHDGRYLYVKAAWFNERSKKWQSTTIGAETFFNMGAFEPESKVAGCADYMKSDVGSDVLHS